MKKILLAAYSLDIGGIEKALVSLSNYLYKKNYDITIVLEEKKGVFIQDLNENIKIIEYKPCKSKNIFKRKIINLINRIKFIIKYKNQFDFSASFATYSLVSSFVSRVASKNNCLWGHADYLTLFNGDTEKVKKFFIERKYNKFKHLVFVWKEGRDSFIKIFPEMKEKTIVCNNIIDANKIKKQAEEDIEIKRDKKITFLNVGRHDEKQKKLSRLIKAGSLLKENGYDYKILLVGDGPDNKLYKDEVKKYDLGENILFLGKKENPYPYFNISDCIILTSDYEGYPVVFLESFILNKPIITTKVSDYKEVENGYGYVTAKDVEDIYEKMKLFIENGFNIKEEFNVQKYNEEIYKKIENLIEENI